jgi:hypothetical protein
VAAVSQQPPMPRWVFQLIMVAVLIASFFFIRKVYDNPVLTVLTLWVVSFGMTGVWVRVFYGFWKWSPSDQYPSFWRGDLLWLPLLVALPLSLLMLHLPQRDQPFWFERPFGWWTAVCVVAALLVSWKFNGTQAAAFPADALHSGPKEWHDRDVYPIFTFFLLSAAPAIWYSDWGLSPLFHGQWRFAVLLALVPFIGAGIWAYEGAVNDRKKDIHAPGGLTTVDAVRCQSWETGAVSGPLQLDPQARAQNTVHWLPPADWLAVAAR